LDTTGIIVILTSMAAAFVQGFSGFGFALISLPILSLVIDIRIAVPFIALCGLTNNIYLTIDLKEHIKFFELKNLIIGAIIGIPIGAFFLSRANPEILKSVLGIIIILFVLFSFFGIIRQKGLHKNYGYFFGLLSGLLGGAFNTNGPPVLIYFFLQGWHKTKQKASITGFFIITSIVVVSSHTVAGLINEQVLVYYLYSFTGVLTGSYLGTRVFAKVSTKFFDKVVLYGLLFVSFFLIFG
jgi:uncharacterized protein